MKSRRNVKLLLGFDGSAYHGWQIQGQQRTVQGELQAAIASITGEQASVIGCGRTDAGTHARGFVANFSTAARIPTASLVRALNSILSPDIRVRSAKAVPASFHARRSAHSKIYRYQIYRGAVLPPHLAREHFHYPYPIDVSVMKKASESFIGAHDFASFAAKGRGRENTVRQIYGCQLTRLGHQLIFVVEGNGFLHHMVRNMVGTLLEVGRGHMSLAEFEALFAVRDRTRAGFTAPARGLILVKVKY